MLVTREVYMINDYFSYGMPVLAMPTEELAEKLVNDLDVAAEMCGDQDGVGAFHVTPLAIAVRHMAHLEIEELNTQWPGKLLFEFPEGGDWPGVRPARPRDWIDNDVPVSFQNNAYQVWAHSPDEAQRMVSEYKEQRDA